MKKKRLAAPYNDYEVTSTGKVISYKRSAEGSPVATKVDKDDYLQVNLSNSEEAHGFKVVRVHELVARAFLGRRPEGAEVLHKDGDRQNNAVSNLEYGSRSKNAQQREAHKREDALVVDDCLGVTCRFDSLPEGLDDFLRLDSTFEVGKWELMPEGYLKATAIVAREAPLDYPEEGRSEYVSEEALISGAESLLYKPVTFEHPPTGEVTDRDWKVYAVGTVVEARYDSGLRAIVAGIVVYDKEAIAAVLRDDIREVSPGYRAAVVADPTYGYRQTRRFSNHLAITRAGRGGPEAAIRLDSEGRTVTQDGDDMADEAEKNDALAEAQKKIDALQAKVDAFEKMAKDKEKEEDEEEKNDSFVRLYNERNDALALAARVGAAVTKDMTNEQLKAAIVNKALGSAMRTDSKERLQGAYEAVASMTPERNTNAHLADTFARNLRTDAAPSSGPDGPGDDMFAVYNDSAIAAGTFQFIQE